MKYTQLGNTGVDISVLGLGGHEYLPDGRSRGFNEDLRLATTPGYILKGLVEKSAFRCYKRRTTLALTSLM